MNEQPDGPASRLRGPCQCTWATTAERAIPQSSSRLPAAAVHDLARDEARIVGGQECDRGRLLFRQAAAPQRLLAGDVGAHFAPIRVGLVFRNVLRHEARTDELARR